MTHVFLRHPAIDGSTLIPDDSDVLRLFESRGWQRSEDLPAEAGPFIEAGDMRAVNELLARQDAERQSQATEEAEALKGKALDEALKERGLPTSGTADEKRARLAEPQAETAATTTTDENERSE